MKAYFTVCLVLNLIAAVIYLKQRSKLTYFMLIGALAAAYGISLSGCARHETVYGNPNPHYFDTVLPPYEVKVNCKRRGQVIYFKTPVAAERVNAVRGNVAHSEPVNYRAIYTVDFKGLKHGDTVLFMADGEVTNDMDQEMLTAWRTTLNEAPITRARGFNLSPGVHHGPVSDQGGFTVTHKSCFVIDRLSFELRAGNNDSNRVRYLKVERGYGQLQGIIFCGSGSR